jgi:hypothetical protein
MTAREKHGLPACRLWLWELRLRGHRVNRAAGAFLRNARQIKIPSASRHSGQRFRFVLEETPAPPPTAGVLAVAIIATTAGLIAHWGNDPTCS